MKKALIGSLLLASCIHICTAAPDDVNIIDRGPHYRVLRSQRAVDLDEETLTQETQVVELESGMHRWNGREWIESLPEIRVVNGRGVAELSYSVTFQPNLASLGAVTITLPDGRRLVSHILGIAYVDGADGVMIAEVKDCAGEIIGEGKSELIYRNAFTDFAIDVHYLVRKGSLSQHILLRQALPSPVEYGLSENATLEVFTEMVEFPVAQKTTRSWRKAQNGKPEVTDDHVSFGTMEFVTGKAFFVGDAALHGETPVAKKWDVLEGRTFLRERLSWKEIRSDLQQLPAAAAVKKKKKGLLAGKDTFLPPRQQANAKPVKPIQVAEQNASTRLAYVLDYELVVSADSMVWKGDTTYYVSGPVSIKTNVFEGGTVIKFAPTNSAKITITGPLAMYASQWRPVFLTARDDHTVGQAIGSNTLSGYYASTALDLDYNTAGTLFDLQQLRIRHAQVGVMFEGGIGNTLSHAQFLNCSNAIELVSSDTSFRNVLIYKANVVFSGNSASTNRCEHLTIDQANDLRSASGPELCFTNSLLVAVTNSASYTGDANITASDGSSIFTSVGAGNHYLVTNSVYRDGGTEIINSSLKNDLKLTTTWPPLVLTNVYQTNITLSQQVLRDTSLPDLGYHYPAIDYCVSSVSISNAVLTLTNGVCIATFGTNGFRLQKNGQIVSQGSPTNMNQIMRYYAVQEQSTNWGNADLLATRTVFAYWTNSPAPRVQMRFTSSEIPGSGGYHIYVGSSTNAGLTNLYVRDSQFSGGSIYLTETTLGKYGFTNNVFERLEFQIQDPAVFDACNNNFRGVAGVLKQASSNGVWRFKDNILDSCSLSNASDITHQHNAFYQSSDFYAYYTTNSTEKVLTNLTYETGPLGRFYQPASSVLINAGSVTKAGSAGFYWYCTTTNSTIEANSQLDIGYHSISVDAYGQPLDSDADGVPNYLQDANGNGLTDPMELTGLKTWLRSDAGITRDGANKVSVWSDQSGNTNTATQGVTVKKPLWVDNALNGWPVIRFDGTSNQLVLTNLSVSNSFTVYAIARATLGHEIDWETNGQSQAPGLTGQRYLFGGIINFDPYGEVGLSFGTNGLSIYEYGRNQVGSDHFAPLAVYDGNLSTNFILICISYTNQYPSLYVNGALVRAGLRSSRSGSVFTKTIGFGTTGSGNSPFSGDLGEVAIFNRALSHDEHAKMIDYFNDRYQLYTHPPATPTITAKPLSPTQVMVYWHQSNTNTTRTGVLERKTGASGTYSTICAFESLNSYLDTNALAATEYYYRVRTRNFAALEEVSNETNAVTPASGISFPFDNLKLWLQAGSKHEEARVGSWQDLTGSTNFALETITTNRPEVVFGALNGWPVIRFDATNDQLVLQRHIVTNTFTVFALAATPISHEIDAESNASSTETGKAGQHYLFGGVNNGNSPSDPWAEAGLSVGTNGFSSYEYSVNQFGANHFAPLAVYNGWLGTNFNLLTLTYSNQKPSLSLNTVLVRTGLTSSRSSSRFALTIGLGVTTSGKSPFSGDVAEILVFDKQLSLGEAGLVARYLNDKYVFVPPQTDPIQLTARALSGTQVALSWRQTGTNALSSYDVERRLGTNGAFTVVGEIGSDWRCIDSGLSGQTLYTYRVRNSLNSSTNAYSNEAVVTTLTNSAAFPLASVALWLRAEDIGVTNNGAVSSWPDFWNLTLQAVQTNAPDQPTWKSNNFNNCAAVYFASARYLNLPAVLSNASAAEIFAVLSADTNSPSANRGLWKFNTNGATWFPMTNGAVIDAFGSSSSQTNLAPLPDLRSPLIYCVAAATNLWRGRMNGPVKQLLTNNIQRFGTASTLGRSSGTTNEAFAGCVGELVIFSSVLSLQEQKTVRDSLAQRFGITLELPHTPSNLNVARTNTVDTVLRWTALTGSENGLESFFVVERQADTNALFLPLQSLARTEVSYLDSSGLPEILYQYRLRSVNDVGETFSSALSMALTDSDGDGLSDYLEGLLGTDPHNADSDGDGLPDGWEVKYGLNPLRSDGRDGASGDFDNDGISNLTEYQQGTNPADGVVGDDPNIRLKVYRPN